MDPHAFCIGLSHLVRSHRLRKKEYGCRGGKHHQAHDCRILPGNAGKTALGPVMQIHDICIVGKGHQDVRSCRADIADHGTAKDQPRRLLHSSRHKEHQSHGGQGSSKGRQDHGRRRHPDGMAQGKHHKACHQKLCPGGDPQDKGACNGIPEKGLEKIT